MRTPFAVPSDDAMSVKQLKAAMQARGLSAAGMVERGELVEALRRH